MILICKLIDQLIILNNIQIVQNTLDCLNISITKFKYIIL